MNEECAHSEHKNVEWVMDRDGGGYAYCHACLLTLDAEELCRVILLARWTDRVLAT